MSLLGAVMTAFPVVAFVADVAALVFFVRNPSWQRGALLLALVYLFPLLAFRLVDLFRPLRPGRFDLAAPVYSPWWGAHRAQLLFGMFPALEMPLMLIPAIYRTWLRAWGSTIGKNVYFAPTFRTLDRGLLRIGDNVFFGHAALISGHLIDPRGGTLSLYVDFVTLESGVFVATGAQLSPGVHLGSGSLVGAFAKLGPKVRVESGKSVEPNAAVRRAPTRQGPDAPSASDDAAEDAAAS